MSLIKRREYFLQLPDGQRVHPFAAPTAAAALAKAQALSAQHSLPAWTLWRDPDATYTLVTRWQGKQKWIDTKFRTLKDAEAFARQVRDSLAAGRLESLEGAKLRKPSTLTMAQLVTAYQEFARSEGLGERTISATVNSMRLVCAKAHHKPDLRLDTVLPSEINARLVYDFKSSILDACEDDDDRAQARRSANSCLRQAKSLFSRRAREHFTIGCGFKLPPCILEFVNAPGFPDSSKEDYRLPADSLIAATFAELEADGPTSLKVQDPNAWLAAWLALGFGLRRSEIAAVRAGWFIEVEGRTVLELRGTVISGSTQEKSVTKNGSSCPRIPPTNGGWQKIHPTLAGLAPDDHVLVTTTAIDRCDGVFRRLSAWMRQLGWGTEKSIHEFRAFAGCQVAMRDGIEAASAWLRHSSILVTQRHYGRYLKPKITDGIIQLPVSQAVAKPA